MNAEHSVIAIIIIIIIIVEMFITVTNSTFQCYTHLDYHPQIYLHPDPWGSNHLQQ